MTMPMTTCLSRGKSHNRVLFFVGLGKLKSPWTKRCNFEQVAVARHDKHGHSCILEAFGMILLAADNPQPFTSLAASMLLSVDHLLRVASTPPGKQQSDMETMYP